MGEGGGQILRTSLALAMVTGQSFELRKIRAGRARPGLMRQHLCAVRAAAEVSGGEVTGDAVGSKDLVFRPGSPRSGAYTFQIGTAGSATLVLQTVLPGLLLAEGTSTVVIEGGTHNPMAPPFDFLDRVFLPLVRRMGPRVEAKIVSYGFYLAGGGRVEATIEGIGSRRLGGLELLSRGELQSTRLRALVSQLPGIIGAREVEAFFAEVPWDKACGRPEVIKDGVGPGNAVVAEVEHAFVTEVFTAIGERGVRAEMVASRAAAEVTRYMKADVRVGEHLADQLLLPMALGEGGVFRTLAPTDHTRTQADVIKVFLGSDVRIEARGGDDVQVEVQKRA